MPLPLRLPLFPLRTVLFPGMHLPLHIFEPRYLQMVGQCVEAEQPFGVVLIRSGDEVGGPAVPYRVGTTATVSRVERLADGRMRIDTLGQERFRIVALHRDAATLAGTVETFPLEDPSAPAAQHLAGALRPWLARYLTLLSEASQTRFDGQKLPQDPAALGYLAAIVAQIPMEEKQALLATASAAQLLGRERRIYRREIGLIRAMLRPRPADSAYCPN